MPGPVGQGEVDRASAPWGLLSEDKQATLVAGIEIAVELAPLDPSVSSRYALAAQIQAGLQAALLSPAIIESRFAQTAFLDDTERDRAFRALAEIAQPQNANGCRAQR